MISYVYGEKNIGKYLGGYLKLICGGRVLPGNTCYISIFHSDVIIRRCTMIDCKNCGKTSEYDGFSFPDGWAMCVVAKGEKLVMFCSECVKNYKVGNILLAIQKDLDHIKKHVTLFDLQDDLQIVLNLLDNIDRRLT